MKKKDVVNIVGIVIVVVMIMFNVGLVTGAFN